jgi:hypothetical protein
VHRGPVRIDPEAELASFRADHCRTGVVDDPQPPGARYRLGPLRPPEAETTRLATEVATAVTRITDVTAACYLSRVMNDRGSPEPDYAVSVAKCRSRRGRANMEVFSRCGFIPRIAHV